MIGLGFAVLAVAYVGLGRYYRNENPSALWVRAISGAHVALAFGIAAFRGDIPPAGWSSALTLTAAVPAAILLWRPQHFRVLFIPMTLWSIASIGFANAPQGLGVVQWITWSIPHIVLSILALGALLTAGAAAAFRLRGYAVGLLATALLLSAVPLMSERAQSIYAFIDDAPAQVEVEIGSLQGDANLIRTLWARAPIPTWPQRTGTALILFAWLIAFAAQWAKRPVPTTVRWLAIIGGAVPVFALCSSWCFSGWVDPDVITQTARETISLELSRDQVIRAIRLPNGAWSGSLGSTAAVLVFPLIAFGLCILAHTEKPHKNKTLASSQLEQRGVQWGCALLTGSVLTGMIWANFSWGGAAFPDPRLFAGITAILLLLAWHVADAEFGPESTAPSWLALTAFLVMLWATLGPSLGWTAPTLHNFGP